MQFDLKLCMGTPSEKVHGLAPRTPQSLTGRAGCNAPSFFFFFFFQSEIVLFSYSSLMLIERSGQLNAERKPTEGRRYHDNATEFDGIGMREPNTFRFWSRASDMHA